MNLKDWDKHNDNIRNSNDLEYNLLNLTMIFTCCYLFKIENNESRIHMALQKHRY